MYSVYVLEEAEDDIIGIYRYIVSNDSTGNAVALYDKIKECINSLGHQPARGHIPQELERIDVTDFLEIHYKPYRIIYQVIKMDVFVHCVFDGRRYLQDILQQRLLRIKI